MSPYSNYSCWIIAFLAFLAASASSFADDFSISRDEEVIAYPTYAYRESGQWVVPIHGVIHERESNSVRRRLMLSQLEKAIPVEKGSEDERRLRSRLQLFVADNERGKKLSVTLGGKTHALSQSGADGVFKTVFKLTDAEAKPLIEIADKSAGWLDYQFVMPVGDARTFGSRVLFMREAGLSVISDIDDTVRDSRVLEPAELIANTFVREFRPVAGMPDLYQRFEQARIPIHYVSASPWQLYVPLKDFFGTSKLPLGTFHMRDFDLKRLSIGAIFQPTQSTKRQSIDPLMKRFPQRKFLLIGDSGEHDPEIYGKLATEFESQVVGIWIRNVPGRVCDDARCQSAFRSPLWRVFDRPEELAEQAKKLIEQADRD